MKLKIGSRENGTSDSITLLTDYRLVELTCHY